ncbi:hypothetical protein GCM10018792_64850 [Streptomyces rubradiris]|nr:hypothetical protein GCM10018792_64850 [Streptomyces rubradiris]
MPRGARKERPRAPMNNYTIFDPDGKGSGSQAGRIAGGRPPKFSDRPGRHYFTLRPQPPGQRPTHGGG